MLRFRSQKPQPQKLHLADLFEELESPLLAHAYSYVQQRELAQDIVQDAFLKLHQSESSVKHPKAWLYRTVKHLAINTGKRKAREASLETTPPLSPSNDVSTTSLPDHSLERNELLGLARLMVAQLDERSKTVLSLKFDDGLSYKQIADRTGLTASNIGYLLHHAVARLADEFKQMGLHQ